MPMTGISRRINSFRRERGMTHSELAKILGITLTPYYRRLKGVSAWTVDDLIRMRDAFDVSVDAIIGGEDAY